MYLVEKLKKLYYGEPIDVLFGQLKENNNDNYYQFFKRKKELMDYILRIENSFIKKNILRDICDITLPLGKFFLLPENKNELDLFKIILNGMEKKDKATWCMKLFQEVDEINFVEIKDGAIGLELCEREPLVFQQKTSDISSYLEFLSDEQDQTFEQALLEKDSYEINCRF